jgi:Flp pilus assembly pilin Flp
MASFMIQSFRRMTKDDNGSAITEYAVVIGLIMVAAIALIANFGTRVLARWNSVNEQLDGTKSVRTPTTPIR